jgi:PAS domain S-box-containing protein
MHDITERRRADAATQIITAIVESSDDAIIGKDLRGIVTSWNPGAENIFGYTADEMLGTSITRLIPAERQAEEGRILAQVARGEPVRHFETVRRCKDGRLVDISVTVSPIKDARDHVVGASKIARDISERKRAEAAVRESNARFASMFNSNPVATSLTTVQGRYLNVNDAFLRMFQWSREEVVGRTVADLDIWVDPARRAALFAALGQHRAVQDFEMVLRVKSGAIIHVSWSGVQLELEGESCLLGSALDVTERKHDEAEIRRLNAELEQRVADRTAELADLYNHAPCGYHSLDADGRFIGINDTELEWLGYAREEIIGKLRVTDLMTPQSIETFRQSYPLFKTSGRLENLELTLVRKDGTLLPVLLSATAATDREGRFARSRSTIIDYSERQRADAALAESSRQLLASNRELEAFSYSVSHDLRAPLRAVDGFSQAVLEDFGPMLPPEGRRQLQTIRESAQRMGVLIDDLLSLSKLSRQPLRQQTLKTKALVQSVLAELDQPRDGRQIEFKVGELPDCLGNPALLRQVWLNLLANAVKYTGKQPSPVVEIGSRPEPGGTVYFVRDNGAGFDMRYAHKLFGVFQRLHRQEDYEGTGVGLAIVQRIVHRHGGRIWAEAAENLGATFYFTLQGETNP